MNGATRETLEPLITAEQSVRRGDYAFPGVGGGVLNFWIYPDALFTSEMPRDLPTARVERNRVLRRTIRNESLWGSTAAIAVSKGTARGWKVEGAVVSQRVRAHDALTYAVAQQQVGYTHFMQYHLQGYGLNDFVAVEIIRERKAWSSAVIGIGHLPAVRCTLTGDPETPLLYRDRQGKLHEMKWWQVGIFSDLPDDDDEEAGGVAVCAAERAYKQIYKLAALEQYVTDKVTGRRPLAIHFVSGISDKQVQEADESATADAQRKGARVFKGALVVPSPNPDISLVTIPLAELPDGFNRKEEFDIALLAYANAWGLDPQDLQPLAGQQLGAGAQSAILNEKAKGRGLNLWHRLFGEWFNAFVASRATTFSWYSRDLKDEEQTATTRKIWAEAGDILIKAGIITAPQYANILVDEGYLPAEFVVQDTTQTDDIADDEKPSAVPEGEEAATVVPPPAPLPARDVEAKAAKPPTAGQKREATRLFEKELARARRVAEELA